MQPITRPAQSDACRPVDLLRSGHSTWASAAKSVASGRLQARVIQRRNSLEQTSSARETVRSPDQLLSDARVAGRMSSIVHDH